MVNNEHVHACTDRRIFESFEENNGPDPGNIFTVSTRQDRQTSADCQWF
jgi:hypothetical protein